MRPRPVRTKEDEPLPGRRSTSSGRLSRAGRMSFCPPPSGGHVGKREAGDVRKRLVEAASMLFYEEGIHATGVDTIVAKAGVAKMSLYKHFASKEDLVTAVLAHRDEAWRAWFDNEVQQRGRTALQRVRAVFSILEDWFKEPGFRGCPFINASTELTPASHPGRAVVAANKAWVRDYLVRLATEARMHDPKEIGGAWFLLFQGAIATSLIEGSPEPAREAGRAALAIAKGRRSVGGNV